MSRQIARRELMRLVGVLGSPTLSQAVPQPRGGGDQLRREFMAALASA